MDSVGGNNLEEADPHPAERRHGHEKTENHDHDGGEDGDQAEEGMDEGALGQQMFGVNDEAADGHED